VPLLVGVLILGALTTRTLTVLEVPPGDAMRLHLVGLLVVDVMLLLLSRCIVNLLRLLLLLLQTLINIILLLVVSGGSGKTVMARDRQELIVVFVGEVEREDRCAVARLRIALSLAFPLRIQIFP